MTGGHDGRWVTLPVDPDALSRPEPDAVAA